MIKKLFITTPTYNGTVHAQYAISLACSIPYLSQAGWQAQFAINAVNTLLVAARNTAIRNFLESDCSHILMIDSDLGWNGFELTQMLENDKDFIGGIYPSRKVANTFIYNPQYADNGGFIGDGSLIKANYIPSGFVLAKREAIQKMYDHYSDLAYESKCGYGDKGVLLFNTEVIDGEFWSEDYVFFKRAKDIGLETWIDPRLTFDHAGVVGGLHLLPEIKNFLASSIKDK